MPGRELGADHRRPQSHAPRVVRLLPVCRAIRAPRPGWLHPTTVARGPAQAGKAPGLRTKPRRPSTLAQHFLRGAWTVHLNHSPLSRETLPMKNPTTGEPCAGKPHARFGGRGGHKPSLPLSPKRINHVREKRAWVAGTSPATGIAALRPRRPQP